MSVAIWPSLPPAELKAAIKASRERELAWNLHELGDTLRSLRTSLEDCYKLLGPDGRGNTLVVSTPRNEIVKGHITRLGTQVVKGTIHLKLRTQAPQTLTINPRQPITIAPLAALNTLLTRSIDLLDMTLNIAYPPPDTPPNTQKLPSSSPSPSPAFIATQLRVLAQALQDASGLLEGPPGKATDPLWATQSASLAHFAPPLPPAMSFYLGLQEGQLVLWLRALEPAGAPVNLGMKFALALGTTRRLEHDEADQTFTYCCEDGRATGLHAPAVDGVGPPGRPSRAVEDGPASVYVREKIRIESADPSLLSLGAKLLALSHSLLAARRNLAAVMGEEVEE